MLSCTINKQICSKTKLQATGCCINASNPEGMPVADQIVRLTLEVSMSAPVDVP
jgi:hypothetical protein